MSALEMYILYIHTEYQISLCCGQVSLNTFDKFENIWPCVMWPMFPQSTLPNFKQNEFSVVRQHEEFIWLHDSFVENEEYAGYIVRLAYKTSVNKCMLSHVKIDFCCCDRSHQLLPNQILMLQERSFRNLAKEKDPWPRRSLQRWSRSWRREL